MDEKQRKIIYQKAKQYVEKLLGERSRTISEIKGRLQQKNFPQKIIDQIILEFIKQGFLNDEKYISLWLENQIKYRPSGRLLCLKKLQEKGLSYTLIKKILEREYSQEKEEKVAEELAKKKIRLLLNSPPSKKAQKIILFLKSRGFSDEIIMKILKKLNFSLFEEI